MHRKRGYYSVGEKKRRHCVVGVTDKWGEKRKRMLFSRREEQTKWVVGMTVVCRGKTEREFIW